MGGRVPRSRWRPFGKEQSFSRVALVWTLWEPSSLKEKEVLNADLASDLKLWALFKLLKTLIFFLNKMGFSVLCAQWFCNYSCWGRLCSAAGVIFSDPRPFSFPPHFPPLITLLVFLTAGIDTSFFVLVHKSPSDRGTRKSLRVKGRSGRKFELI